jgi:hypothetical protein
LLAAIEQLANASARRAMKSCKISLVEPLIDETPQVSERTICWCGIQITLQSAGLCARGIQVQRFVQGQPQDDALQHDALRER